MFGEFVSGIFNMMGTQATNNLNRQTAANATRHEAEQAQKQMDFQERMSNTSRQREVKDLKAAGLNPLLAAGGQGASTPQGAAGAAHTYDAKNPLANFLSSAQEFQMLRQGKERHGKEMKALDAQTNKTNIEAKAASKAIPEADLKNKIYDKISPIIDKVLGADKSSAKQKPYVPSEAMKKIHAEAVKNGKAAGIRRKEINDSINLGLMP